MAVTGATGSTSPADASTTVLVSMGTVGETRSGVVVVGSTNPDGRMISVMPEFAYTG
jgi:L-lactate utilization protein LutC